MEVGELMAFKPVTAPKRPAHKEEIQGTSLIIIKYPMLNRYCNRVCVRMQLQFPIGHIDGFNVHSFRKIVLHFECK